MSDVQEYLDEREAKLEQEFTLGRALVMAIVGWFVWQIIFGKRKA